MKPVKVGIIGFGRIGEGCHLKALSGSKSFQVVGVCDVTESRRAVAQAAGLKATGDLSEFLSWDIELAVIATHSSQHYADALACAKAGKHMLIEKPIAPTAKQAEEMIDAAKKAKVVLSVFHNRHFDNDYRMVKAAVQEGLLGELVLMENRSASPRPAVGFGVADYRQAWRITAADGGGTLLDFGPHWIEQILDLMAGRKVVQVFGDVRHVLWGDVDDVFRVDMVFDNGVRAMASKVDISHYPLPYKWLAIGTKATATTTGSNAETILIQGPDFELKRKTAVPAVSLHENVAQHIREGKELIITPAHALRVMKVIQAGIDSAKAGKSLDVAI